MLCGFAGTAHRLKVEADSGMTILDLQFDRYHRGQSPEGQVGQGAHRRGLVVVRWTESSGRADPEADPDVFSED
jgi:hypothetical protein